MDREEIIQGETEQSFPEQDEFGNDLEWLRYNLSLTPTQRYEKHQRRLLSVMRLREAVRTARTRKTG